MKNLKDFRKRFSIDARANLSDVAIAINAIYESQDIGFNYLGNIDAQHEKEGIRIHSFLNLMSRIFEHAQAMLVAIATGSFTSAEALARIVVEGSINLMYLALHGDTGTLINYFQSWVNEHEKKLKEWKKKIEAKPYANEVGKMIDARMDVVIGFKNYIDILKERCEINSQSSSLPWPPILFQRFSTLNLETDYYESYHRLSGSSHITSEDTLLWLISLNLEPEQIQKMGVEARAYSVMMSRMASKFFVEAVAACVISHGRKNNDDLQEHRRKLAQAIHEIASKAGVPLCE